MLRLRAPLLLLLACSSTPEVAPPREEPSLRELAGRLKLQLRRGPGLPPCRLVGGGVEACPVVDEPKGPRFLSSHDLAAMNPRDEDGGPPAAEHAFLIGYLALVSSATEAEITWIGDAEEPHLVAVMTRHGGEGFDAARLLALPAKVEELVDDLGLQFLAAVPDTRTLLLFRDEDGRASAMARKLVADRAGSPQLAPDSVFVVTPEGVRARPW